MYEGATTASLVEIQSRQVGDKKREQIENEIAEGKLGIARDRLHGLVIAYPDRTELRSRLGDVYWKLGYPIEAGRFWFLDSDLTDEKKEAIDRFIVSCDHSPATVLKRLKLRCSPAVLTESHARKRVEELIESCKEKGETVPTFSPARTFVPDRNVKKIVFGCSAAIFVLIALAVIGAFTLLKTAIGW